MLWDQGLSSREGCRQSGRLPIERRPSLCQPHCPSCCVPTLPGTPRPGGAPQAQNTQPKAGAVASAPRPAPAEGRSCSRARPPPVLYSVGLGSRKRERQERVGRWGFSIIHLLIPSLSPINLESALTPTCSLCPHPIHQDCPCYPGSTCRVKNHFPQPVLPWPHLCPHRIHCSGATTAACPFSRLATQQPGEPLRRWVRPQRLSAQNPCFPSLSR